MAETLLPFDYRPFSSGIRFTKTIYIYREMSVAWLGAVRVGNNTLCPYTAPTLFTFSFSFSRFTLVVWGYCTRRRTSSGRAARRSGF